MGQPGFLYALASRRVADRFDGGDLGPHHGADRHDAGAHRVAVHVHGAGTAQRHAAAELGTGHAEHVAQHPQQGRVVVHVDLVLGAVDLEKMSHETSSPIR
ncbi:hypothetical protein D3C85_1632430 [compost metagenome]